MILEIFVIISQFLTSLKIYLINKIPGSSTIMMTHTIKNKFLKIYLREIFYKVKKLNVKTSWNLMP